MSLKRRTFLKLLGGTGATSVLGREAQAARQARKPSADAYGLLYDATRCIGCKACVVACADANGLPRESRATENAGLYQDPVDLSGNTKNIIKLFKDGSRTSFVKVQCMHCVDPACVSVCMIGALHKAEHDIVAYNKERCIGCRYCQVACPFNIPRFEWAKRAPLIVKCELCRHRIATGAEPGCTTACPTKAVVFGTRQALLADAKKRLAMNPNLYASRIYGETDVGGTQVLYLTARNVSFADLGLPDLGDQPAPHLSESIQHGLYQGFIAPAALYAALTVAIFRNRKKAGSAASNAGDDGAGGAKGKRQGNARRDKGGAP